MYISLKPGKNVTMNTRSLKLTQGGVVENWYPGYAYPGYQTNQYLTISSAKGAKSIYCRYAENKLALSWVIIRQNYSWFKTILLFCLHWEGLISYASDFLVLSTLSNRLALLRNSSDSSRFCDWKIGQNGSKVQVILQAQIL